MQPYFMPYIGYWQLIKAADIFVYYDDVTFIKQGWINRNRILSNGLEQMFTIYVNGASSFTTIKEVLVGGNRKRVLKTISQAYAKAPFFQERLPLLNKIFLSAEGNLCNYIEQSNAHILEILRIQSTMIRSSQFDFDSTGKGQERVIRICKELGATTYINSFGGRDLYSKNDFADAGISLQFLQPTLMPYEQNGAHFVGGLSILDVLMFNNTTSVINMLEQYQLLKK